MGQEEVIEHVRGLVPGLRHYRDLLSWKLRKLPRRRFLERRRTRATRAEVVRLLEGYLSIGGDPVGAESKIRRTEESFRRAAR